MIRLQNVNKYFNRRKSNEIHVINDTSLDLPESGIVTFLGPSGCGKTTLLNAIGGLDKVNSGKIYIDRDNIAGALTGRKDTIRNAKIGYIFQDFNLIDNRTVFDNVAVALRMVGVRDHKIIKDRVNYCLESVGIYQFRNKTADALSGGQRQRVAIARAIVKNPRIIIADEPTGNLDSANTLEIMNIIKTISRERLVILVTHERNIAEFYSDRIIELKDGSIISDMENDSSRSMDYQLENRIYLRDMPVAKRFRQDAVEVDVYSDEERDAGIKLVIRGGNLYINTGGRFNVVDETANIEMIDDHYSELDESIYENTKFEYDKYMPYNFRAKYRSIYTPLNMIGNGFKTIARFKLLKRLLLIGFVFASMFMLLAVSSVLGVYDIKDEDFLTTNNHYVTVSNPKKSLEVMEALGNLESAEYALPGSSMIQLSVPLNDYYQTANAIATLNGSLAFTSVLNENGIKYGRMPEKDHEIAVDRMVLEKFTKKGAGNAVGVKDVKQFLDRKADVRNLDSYTIVAITDSGSPTIYVKENQWQFILTNAPEGDPDYEYSAYSLMEGGMYEEEYYEDDSETDGATITDYKLAPDALKIKTGSEPKNDYEVILPNSFSEITEDPDDGDEDAEPVATYKIGRKINVKMAGEKLKLVGFYTSDNAEQIMYVNSETILKNFMNKKKTVSVYAKDTSALAGELEAEGYSYKVNYDRDRKSYMKRMRSQMRSSLIVAGLILLIALVEMFLMLRSSFLSRIKEIGILRAIGLKKKDIYRMFIGEIVSITCVTAIPGIILMYYILKNISGIAEYLEGMYMVNTEVAILAFIMTMVFNLIAGLIPVFRTMRKTPAAILARTDI